MSSMTSITWKKFSGIICYIFISEVKLNLYSIFEHFQNVRHFHVATNIFTGSDTGSSICQQDSHEHFRHFELLIDVVAQILTEIYSNFKIWPTLWPGDVIDDVMCAWNITCTTRFRQICTCKILFVWHQSFIVKSSGQTSWQTNKHTKTQGENIITFAIAGDNDNFQ